MYTSAQQYSSNTMVRCFTRKEGGYPCILRAPPDGHPGDIRSVLVQGALARSLAGGRSLLLLVTVARTAWTMGLLSYAMTIGAIGVGLFAMVRTIESWLDAVVPPQPLPSFALNPALQQ